jgi:HK97 family phage major capsid protein
MPDKDELNDVFSKYKATVNMSASELERWADTECSKKASLDRSPIKRNLRLLRKKKSDWTDNDIKDANKTISFIERMKNGEQGEQVSEECPYSKRDISLRNWAFNPDKGSKSMHVKFISEDEKYVKVAGYGIVFNTTDLVGDTFSPDTELGFKRSPVGMPVYYSHNMESLKGNIGQVTDYAIDDTGVWFEMELDKSNKYLEGIRKLVANKRLGLSTGALPHTLEKDEYGNLKTWIAGEISLTVTPAESKTIGISEVKDLNGDRNTMAEEQKYTAKDVEEGHIVDLQATMKDYNAKVDQLLEMWANTKDVKTGKVGGGTKENEATSFGSFLKAVAQKDYERIEQVYNEHPANAMKVLNTGTGTDGGYLVPQQFLNQFMATIERMEIVRPRAMVQPIPFGNIEIPGIDYNQTWDAGHDPLLGGLKMYWTAEGAEDTQSEPEFRQIELRSNEATTSVPVTNKLLDNNAIGLEALLMRLFTAAAAYTEDYAYIRGDGVGKPLGVQNAAATISVDVTAAGVTVDDLASMYVRLDPDCVDTAVWLVNPLLYKDIMSLNADNDSALTFLPDINGRITPMLFGMPLYRTKILQNSYANAGLMLVDFNKYVIGQDLQLEIAMSEHVAFRKRQTVWRATVRTDGQPLMNAAVPIGSTSDETVSFAVQSSTA